MDLPLSTILQLVTIHPNRKTYWLVFGEYSINSFKFLKEKTLVEKHRNELGDELANRSHSKSQEAHKEEEEERLADVTPSAQTFTNTRDSQLW